MTGFVAAFTEGPIDFYKSQLQVQIIRSKQDPNYKRERARANVREGCGRAGDGLRLAAARRGLRGRWGRGERATSCGGEAGVGWVDGVERIARRRYRSLERGAGQELRGAGAQKAGRIKAGRMKAQSKRGGKSCCLWAGRGQRGLQGRRCGVPLCPSGQRRGLGGWAAWAGLGPGLLHTQAGGALAHAPQGQPVHWADVRRPGAAGV